MALKATAGVQCAEEQCTSMSHKKTACSGISKYSSDKWRCNAHRKVATRETDHTETLAGRPVEMLTQREADSTRVKRSCSQCKRTIASITVPVTCSECNTSCHKGCVARLGFSRDQVDFFVEYLKWMCSSCAERRSSRREPESEKIVPPVEPSQREGAHSRNKIRILQWNVDGVNTKTTELAARLQELDIDIGLVQESKLAKKNQTRGFRATHASGTIEQMAETEEVFCHTSNKTCSRRRERTGTNREGMWSPIPSA